MKFNNIKEYISKEDLLKLKNSKIKDVIKIKINEAFVILKCKEYNPFGMDSCHECFFNYHCNHKNDKNYVNVPCNSEEKYEGISCIYKLIE